MFGIQELQELQEFRSSGVQEFRMQISVREQIEIFIAWSRLITIHRPGSHRLILQLLNSCNFSETWSWRWLSGRLRKFNKIEAKSIGAFA